MKHETDYTYTLVLTVRNNPGVLVRCAQIFNRRGHNIEALQVTAVPGSHEQSHMKITAFGNKEMITQIIMQLQKLFDVEHVTQER